MEDMDFETLKGKTLISIENLDNREIIFKTDSNETYRLIHYQDCCEDVYVESIDGNLDNLLNTPILQAEVVTKYDEIDNYENLQDCEKDADSYTWTFYKIATFNGYVTIRWFGESNGYYSEEVDFEKVSE